ncbi:MAG: hypothetical protein WC827_01725 [Candidatus Paceibacterota bacterium]|jgi:hypothetical protein
MKVKHDITLGELGVVCGLIIIVIFAIIYWYIGIPALVIWYLFKKRKNKFPLKTNLIIAGGTLGVVFSVFFINLYIHRTPSLTISEPQDLITLQVATTTIKGKVSPSSSNLTVNGISIKANFGGHFIYEASLKNENNTYTFIANNKDKSQTQTLTIKRIFTADELAQIEQAKKEALAKAEKDKADELKIRLQREIDSFNKPFDNSIYRNDITSLTLEVMLFSGWAKWITEGKESNNTEVKNLANQLEQKVSQRQIKEFPLMRKTYAKLIGNLLWEQDISVETLGATNKTIQLTGGIFVANKSKSTIQEQLSKQLRLFRFTTANYKWYEYDETYTYYDMDSYVDSKVIEL